MATEMATRPKEIGVSAGELLAGIDNFLKTVSEMPVMGKQDEIRKILTDDNYQSLFLEAEPGAGKTVGAPPLILKVLLSKNPDARILITQPRKPAVEAGAKTAGENIGLPQAAGYHHREKREDPNTRIEFTVERSLFNELKRDPKLSHYDAVMLDEIHGVTTELLMPSLRKAQMLRKDSGKPLKLVFATATAEEVRDTVTNYFPDTAHLKVEGKIFPLNKFFADEDVAPDDIPQKAAEQAAKIIEEGKNDSDILIFMPGMEKITQTMEALSALPSVKDSGAEIDFLIGGKENKENVAKINRVTDKRKIFVATNVAEEALTFPNLRNVIVPGYRNTKITDHETGVSFLSTVRITRANADQQAGRGARIGEGDVYFLFTENTYDHLPKSKRSFENLENDILILKTMGISDVYNFDWVYPPPKTEIDKTIVKLKKLGVLDKDGNPTAIAEKMEDYETEVPFARMLAETEQIQDEKMQKNCRNAVGILIGLMNQGRIFTREFRQSLKYMPAGQNSDFIMLLRMWNDYVNGEQIPGVNMKVFGSAGITRRELLGERRGKDFAIDLSEEEIVNIKHCVAAGLLDQILTRKGTAYEIQNTKLTAIGVDRTSVISRSLPERVLAGILRKDYRGRVIAEFNQEFEEEILEEKEAEKAIPVVQTVKPEAVAAKPLIAESPKVEEPAKKPRETFFSRIRRFFGFK